MDKHHPARDLPEQRGWDLGVALGTDLVCIPGDLMCSQGQSLQPGQLQGALAQFHPTVLIFIHSPGKTICTHYLSVSEVSWSG